MEKTFYGLNGILILNDRGITIKRGARGLIVTGILRGDKTIPYSSIIAIQFRKSFFLFSGSIQFSLRGGSEAKGGYFESGSDENTITFSTLLRKDANEDFTEAKEIIEEKMYSST